MMSPIFPFLSRLAMLMFFVFVTTGISYCRESFSVAGQAEVGTEDDNDQTDDDDDPSDDGTEEDDDGGSSTTTTTSSTTTTTLPGSTPSDDDNGATPTPTPTLTPTPTPTPEGGTTDDQKKVTESSSTRSIFGEIAEDAARKGSVGVRRKASGGSGSLGTASLPTSSAGSSTSGSSFNGTWLGNIENGGNAGEGVDSDGDGFTDALEKSFGTDSLDSLDTPPGPKTSLLSRFRGIDDDLDGVANSDEDALGLDKNNPDTDGDGVRDGLEEMAGSSPLDQNSLPDDSDGDGLDAELERRYGTNSGLVDSDNDLLSDGDEVLIGSNPLQADTDKDGILDGTEVELGGDPKVPEKRPSTSS